MAFMAFRRKGVFVIHELAITGEVLKIVLKYAEENQASRVVSINLQAGELRDLTEEWLQRYFDYLSRETIAEGAEIVLKKVPLSLRCAACTGLFHADIRRDDLQCPACGGLENELVGGNEFLIESIGVI